MKKNLVKVLVLSVVFMAQSCSDKLSDQEIDGVLYLELGEIESIAKEDLTIVDVVPLETVNENLMGQDLRIRFSKDRIFVFDESIQDAIHVFDRNGKFMGTRVVVGEGPNTVNRLIDFYVSYSGELEILNPIGGKAQIFEVNEDKSLNHRFTVEYSCSSFTKLPNGEYLFYGSYNLPYVSHRMIRTDSAGVVLERYLENDYTNQMLPMTERNFFDSNSNLYLAETFNNVGYQFIENQLKSIIQVDFGNYAIPARFWELNLMEGGFDLLQQNGFANLNGFFKNDENSLVGIHVQKPTGISKNIIFINEKSGEQRLLETKLLDDYLFHYPIGVEENEFLFLTYRSTLLEDYGNLLSDKIKSKVPEKEFDYPVILKVQVNDENK
jgi:hypothetical protein